MFDFGKVTNKQQQNVQSFGVSHRHETTEHPQHRMVFFFKFFFFIPFWTFEVWFLSLLFRYSFEV